MFPIHFVVTRGEVGLDKKVMKKKVSNFWIYCLMITIYNLDRGFFHLKAWESQR